MIAQNEAKVLDLGRKVLRSLDDQETLKPEIQKDDFLTTLKVKQSSIKFDLCKTKTNIIIIFKDV